VKAALRGLIAPQQDGFSDKLAAFVSEYMKRMLGPFQYVCTYWVKEKYHHQVPKYILIFATRSADGVDLMNDFMCQARRKFVASQFSKDRLFDATSEEELVDSTQLCEDIAAALKDAGHPLSRKDLRVSLLLRGYFTKLLRGEVNAAIGGLLKEGRVFSKTGRVRINDSVFLSHEPFTRTA
jgi:hypothetical protein